MFCPNCGKENPEGNAVCFSCGEDLTRVAAAQAAPAGTVHIPVEPAQQTQATAAQPAATQQPAVDTAVAGAATTAQPAAAAQPAATAQPAAQAQPTATAQPAATAQAQPAQAAPQSAPYQQATAQQTGSTPYQQAAPQPQQTGYAAPQPTAAPQQPAQQLYKKGCIASAWDDIKNSDGWFTRILLLGLINIVPILNWIVPGYCMRWARQLPMGKIQPMPKTIFVNRGFINGVFWFVITLVFSLVGAIAAGILGIVPLLGWIASLAIMFFIAMFGNLAYMRIAVADRLGAGFDISALWEALKKNPGSLLCISIVPGLVIGACIGILALVVFGIAAIGIGSDVINLAYLSDYAPYGYGYDSMYGSAAAMSVLSIIGKLLPAYLILYIVACFAQAFQYVLVFRALGHWTARYASGWVNEPAIQASANLYPDQQ